MSRGCGGVGASRVPSTVERLPVCSGLSVCICCSLLIVPEFLTISIFFAYGCSRVTGAQRGVNLMCAPGLGR